VPISVVGKVEVCCAGVWDSAVVRIFVTGHRGFVGSAIFGHLDSAGHEVVGFDAEEGDDLLDLEALRAAGSGTDAVVHLAALAHDTAGCPEQIMATNVLGTFHVLLATEAASVARVVYFSSGQVFGIADGEQLPDYFPVDDAHPVRTRRPYGVSKHLAEELCETFSLRTGIPTVCLRPVAVWKPDQYRMIWQNRQEKPSSEWEPFWEFGAFVDVRDVATAVDCALTHPDLGHVRALLCVPDISATSPAIEMVRRLAPGVPIRDLSQFEAAPWRALFDCTVAETTIGWRPRHSWASWVSAAS
jgi:UDP-glucose 4-epimerase